MNGPVAETRHGRPGRPPSWLGTIDDNHIAILSIIIIIISIIMKTQIISFSFFLFFLLLLLLIVISHGTLTEPAPLLLP